MNAVREEKAFWVLSKSSILLLGLQFRVKPCTLLSAKNFNDSQKDMKQAASRMKNSFGIAPCFTMIWWRDRESMKNKLSGHRALTLFEGRYLFCSNFANCSRLLSVQSEKGKIDLRNRDLKGKAQIQNISIPSLHNLWIMCCSLWILITIS